MEEQEYVWIFPHPEKVWFPGRVLSKTDLIVKAEDNKNQQFEIAREKALFIKKRNLKIVENLLKLPDFHEGLLLHVIRERYSQNLIYTSIGLPILLAINPYKNLEIYNSDHKKIYRNKTLIELKESPPHLYKTAEVAYRNMKSQDKPQSIIITGESGAGKTESTKILLNYISGLSKKKNMLEDKIVYINPVLEAFGNAKTVRNDNSSRFGKFIELEFEQNLKSAKITNYLLEKSRIISQNEDERNYHIFYQLFFCEDQKINDLTLIDKEQNFRYLNLNYKNLNKFIKKDCEEFQEVLEKMKGLNFDQNVIECIFKTVSGILHLGEVIIEGDEYSSKIDESDENLLKASKLFGILPEVLISLITNKIFVDPMSKKNLVKNIDLNHSEQTRDTLSKIIYNCLFNWIVKGVNKAIHGKKGLLTNGSKDSIKHIKKVILEKRKKSLVPKIFNSVLLGGSKERNLLFNDNEEKSKLGKIGILDIFGFEIFENNSFEQFCINYTNEKLQGHFNKHMFSLEQNLYKAEELPWENIEFPDNKEVIKLIEGIPISVYSLLDQLCMYKNSTDLKFLDKLRTNFRKNENFMERNLNIKFEVFGIRHFAGNVYYNINNFIKKNRNSVDSQFFKEFSKSENLVLSEIFTEKLHLQLLSNKKIKTVSHQFRNQLSSLITELNKSLSLYVRCIKPNNIKKPSIFDSSIVSHQLKAAGMLEAIKIRKAGYPIRRTYLEFYKIYKHLFLEYKINNNDCKGFFKYCFDNSLIMKVFDQNHDTVIFGKTLVFMKESVKFDLDMLLDKCYYKFATVIQKNARYYIWRKRMRNFKKFIRNSYRKIKIYNGIDKIVKKIREKKSFYKKFLDTFLKFKNKSNKYNALFILKELNIKYNKKIQLQAINDKLKLKEQNLRNLSPSSIENKKMITSPFVSNNEGNKNILNIFDVKVNKKNFLSNDNLASKNLTSNLKSKNELLIQEKEIKKFFKSVNSEDKNFSNRKSKSSLPIHNSIQLLNNIIEEEIKNEDEEMLNYPKHKSTEINNLNLQNVINKLKSENLTLKKELNDSENQIFKNKRLFTSKQSITNQELIKKNKLIKSLQENLQLYQFECSNYKEKYIETRKDLEELQNQIKEGYYDNNDFEEKIMKINNIIEKKNIDIRRYKILIKELKEKHDHMSMISKNNLEVLKEREVMLDNVLQELKNFRSSQEMNVSQFNQQNSLLFRQNGLCKDIINNLLTLLKWKTVENKICSDIKNNLRNNKDSRILEDNLDSLLQEEKILKNEVQVKMKKLENMEKSNQIDEVEDVNLQKLEAFKKSRGNVESEIFFE